MFFDNKIVRSRATCNGRILIFFPAESRFHLASKKGQGATLSKMMDGKNILKKWVIYGHSRANADKFQMRMRQFEISERFETVPYVAEGNIKYSELLNGLVEKTRPNRFILFSPPSLRDTSSRGGH